MGDRLPGRFLAPIVSRRTHGCVVELVIEAPALSISEPGQFIHVHCGSDAGRILRRPYSLYDAGDGTASLLVRVVGSGSAWLAGREVGDAIDLLGPLGRGFSITGRGKNVLVAGGTGIAPLCFLLRRMKEKGIEAVLLWGMERGEDYGELPRILGGETDLRLASRDGKVGFEGSVLGLFGMIGSDGFESVYACGPRGMLVDLAGNIDRMGCNAFQVSLEERMACGVGVCKGCAVPARVPPGGYLTVCRDGPVFDGKEIDWERMYGLNSV